MRRSGLRSPVTMTTIERVVWQVRGKDPLAFLQATTTQDHTGQAIGEVRWCTTLDPNGRVLAFLRSIPIDDETVLLDGEATCESGVSWLAQIAPLSRCTVSRTDRTAEPVDAERDEWTRISAGWPRFGIDVTDRDLLNDTPLLALCTSFTKGCYRGQETVAKIQNLGHARRALAKLEIASGAILEPGTGVFVDGAEIGRVTSSAMRDGTVRALASVRKEHERADVAVDGQPSRTEPIELASLDVTTPPPQVRPVSNAFGRSRRSR